MKKRKSIEVARPAAPEPQQEHSCVIEFGGRCIEIAFTNLESEGIEGHVRELLDTAEAMQHAANRLNRGETYALADDTHAIVKGTQIALSLAGALRGIGDAARDQ